MERFWYMASPYTRYFRGEAQAAHDAIAHAALLVEYGVNVFTPVGHSYALEVASQGRVSWGRWLELDFAILRGACGLIRLKLPGWSESKDMNKEENFAKQVLKIPVVRMVPWPVRGSAELQYLLDWLITVQEGLAPTQEASASSPPDPSPQQPQT